MIAKPRIKAEDGSAAWLRYHPLSRRSAAERTVFLAWQGLLTRIIVRGGERADPVFATAVSELKLGIKKLMGFESAIEFAETRPTDRGAAISDRSRGGWNPSDEEFGFTQVTGDRPGLELHASHSRGLLYGVFHLLENLAAGLGPQELAASSQPANPLRMLDHWDNMDGSVERGYAGRSIFFRSGKLARRQPDLRRLSNYARLLASVGINAVAINNVNVHAHETWLVTPTHQADLVRMAGIFRAWGIRLFISVNYAAPLQIGETTTADPLEKSVADWWEARAKELWAAIPDFGGWLVKADSEGRPGPFTYGRSHADGANMLARAVSPHGGIILWRCFVYNCRQDWRDRKTDRARAAYDHFVPLDGTFDDNVLLQIKNGPMDFQVREPVSPLLGGMKKTNQLLELQITQEYTGQQRHVCCLLPQWREVLDFPTHAQAQKGDCPVSEVASGQLFSRPLGGMTAVANIGDDLNWTGHHLAQVNLFGFGRLAWNPASPVREIIDRWTALSFGTKPELVAKLGGMLAASWKTYESYTAPLGVGWMVNPEHHYGPNVDGYEYSRWGTYHFADRDGIGVDRSRLRGTGYTGQYHEPWASHYDDRSRCADELLLFFHHVAWNHRLHSGKTVIQHIYDSHFAGVLEVAGFVELWRGLSRHIDGRRHREVMDRLEHQLAHAAEWRDQINTYCYRKSGIGDAAGRTLY